MRKLLLFVASVALVSAGCGGSKMPTAPTSSQDITSAASPAGAGAGTISGTVRSGSVAAAGMGVAVVNTALSTRSDDTGHFTLANVPSGDVQLRVSG